MSVVAGHEVPRVVTPAVRASLAFPRGAAWFAGTIVAASFVGSVAGVRALTTVSEVLGPFALLGAAVIAAWAESRVFQATERIPAIPRLVLALVMPLASLLGGFLAIGVVVALVGLVVRTISGPGPFVLAFLVSWFAAASLGSAVVLAIDLFVRLVAARFRTRLIIAFSSLMTVAVLVSFAFAFLVLAACAWLHAPESRARLDALVAEADDPSFTRLADGLLFLAGQPHYVVLVALSLTFVIALPSFLSATSKLADAVMERIHPLGFAFEAVAKGRRDVRLEEAGSREFVEMSASFNQMVEALSLSERMERAFGLYVSGQVLEKIRAQHGEAVIPPALREASVFFADIRGFTSMSERLAPNEIVSVLNRWFDRVLAQVERHEGYLNKFVGDAVVVVFNGPIDQPDHAARASRCAIALQEEVARLNAEHAFPEIGTLAVGVGVATGAMVCGNVGSARQMEYTVIGDTVNLASRLTGRAAKGEVLVSEATARVLPPEVPGTPLDAIPVKGKERPVVPYRIWPRGSA